MILYLQQLSFYMELPGHFGIDLQSVLNLATVSMYPLCKKNEHSLDIFNGKSLITTSFFTVTDREYQSVMLWVSVSPTTPLQQVD